MWLKITKWSKLIFVLILSLLVCCEVCKSSSFGELSKGKQFTVEGTLNYDLEFIAKKLEREFRVTSNEELGITYIEVISLLT